MIQCSTDKIQKNKINTLTQGSKVAYGKKRTIKHRTCQTQQKPIDSTTANIIIKNNIILHAHAHTHTHTDTDTHTHTLTHTRTQSHAHTNTHTQTGAHKHTHIRPSRGSHGLHSRTHISTQQVTTMWCEAPAQLLHPFGIYLLFWR